MWFEKGAVFFSSFCMFLLLLRCKCPLLLPGFHHLPLRQNRFPSETRSSSCSAALIRAEAGRDGALALRRVCVPGEAPASAERFTKFGTLSTFLLSLTVMFKVIVEIGTFSLESSFLFENTSTQTFGEANLEFGLQSNGSLVQIHFHIRLLREESDYVWFGSGLGWVWDHGGPDREVPLEFECWGRCVSPSGS